MRNLLAFLAAVVLLASGLGWWRGYYAISGLPAETGKFAFRIEFNAVKVGSDLLDLVRRAQRSATPDKAEPAPVSVDPS